MCRLLDAPAPLGCLGPCGSRALTHSRPAKFLPHDAPAPRAAWVLRVTRAQALASCQACSSASSAAWVPAGHARSRVLASCQVLAMMLQRLRAAWVLRVTHAHARASCQVCRRDRSSAPVLPGSGGSCTRMRARPAMLSPILQRLRAAWVLQVTRAHALASRPSFRFPRRSSSIVMPGSLRVTRAHALASCQVLPLLYFLVKSGRP